ncbi:MAG: GNAT family N-acetyltransferase [Alphaproteobacteria bacterium]|nr:GNAT family N-acetyltransferase [Alphaproteobacteria bacterium]
MTQVVRLDHDLPESFAALDATARAEGYDFLARLARNWRDGAYLGDADASVFGVYGEGDLVAVGAQTADEYDPSPDHRRIRHFYVHPDTRRSGIGTTLAGTLIQEAFQLAPLLHLRATHVLSGAFWDSLGFERVDRPDRSHRLVRV